MIAGAYHLLVVLQVHEFFAEVLLYPGENLRSAGNGFQCRERFFVAGVHDSLVGNIGKREVACGINAGVLRLGGRSHWGSVHPYPPCFKRSFTALPYTICPRESRMYNKAPAATT